jgi:hypothetical protein
VPIFALGKISDATLYPPVWPRIAVASILPLLWTESLGLEHQARQHSSPIGARAKMSTLSTNSIVTENLLMFSQVKDSFILMRMSIQPIRKIGH